MLGYSGNGAYFGRLCTVNVNSMEIHVTLGEAGAIIVGELFSFLWYAGYIPKVEGRYSDGDRSLPTALLCGVVLALMLQVILSKQWIQVNRWYDVLKMAAWITILYSVLVAPHSKINLKFAYSILHKFILLFLMSLTIHLCMDPTGDNHRQKPKTEEVLDTSHNTHRKED